MTKEQERARARRRHQKVQAKQAKRARDRARRVRVAAVCATVLVIVGGLAVVATRFSGEEPAQTPAAAASPSTVAGCQPPPSPLGTGARLELPDKKAAAGKTFVATLTTNCGDIELTLDGAKAPQAVAAVVELARQNYWQSSPCHRLTASEDLKVLQCGDPTGTGQGDPGFGYGVENAPKDGAYPRGTVAMARTKDPEKGTGGQFFVVWGDSSLPDPDGYTVVGTVTAGLDIVDRIAAAGIAPGGSSPTDGSPAAPISILRVAVTEKKA